jgi:hypothetical protein
MLLSSSRKKSSLDSAPPVFSIRDSQYSMFLSSLDISVSDMRFEASLHATGSMIILSSDRSFDVNFLWFRK